jgi:hypothetical protein
MNVELIKRRHNVGLALAGAAICACTLVSSPVSALAADISCNIVEVGFFVGSRIHVLCNPGAGAIIFFALSASTFDATRVLSLAETAEVTGRRLIIRFDPNDLSGQGTIGCLNTDCRLIQAVFLQKN